MTDAINLAEKLATFADYFAPRTVTQFNGHDVMVAKLKGPFVWHKHDDTDDFFFVLVGTRTSSCATARSRSDPGRCSWSREAWSTGPLPGMRCICSSSNRPAHPTRAMQARRPRGRRFEHLSQLDPRLAVFTVLLWSGLDLDLQVKWPLMLLIFYGYAWHALAGDMALGASGISIED